MPETCIFYYLYTKEVLYQVRSCHWPEMSSRADSPSDIFKMRWVSVANDHLGPKPLISDSATQRSLWPLECQPVALDDNEWQISKTLIQSSIQTHGQVSKKSYFDIWHFWKYEDLIIGAGAGAGAAGAGTFCPEPEPEPEPRNSFTRSRSRSRSRIASPEPEPEPEPTKNVTAPHPWFQPIDDRPPTFKSVCLNWICLCRRRLRCWAQNMQFAQNSTVKSLSFLGFRVGFRG